MSDDEPRYKKVPEEDKTPVTITADQYRSLILAKLRADIAAKQAAFDKASAANVPDLTRMAYWKMAYWKMKYWKMKLMDAPPIVDPETRG